MSLKLRKNISVGVGLLWVKWLFAEEKPVGPSLWDFQKTCCSSEMAVSRPLLTLKNNAIFSRNHSKCHKLKKQENCQKSGFYIVKFPKLQREGLPWVPQDFDQKIISKCYLYIGRRWLCFLSIPRLILFFKFLQRKLLKY